MRVLVTGANGFLGGALVQRLSRDGEWELRAAVRDASAHPAAVACETVSVRDIDATTSWRAATAGCDVVVHTAARVHVMREDPVKALALYRRVNVQGTLHLAQEAKASGVRRLVYISSIKVNGEQTSPGCAFRADDAAAPQDHYGLSKFEAELALREFAVQTGMELVILRPPLMYGPGVRANFRALMRAVSHGLPLPLGAIHNRRSLLALDNAVDLIVTCLRHPHAAGKTFLASDNEDLSTPELVRRLARALHTKARLVSVPPAILQASARLLGKGDAMQRLCGSLQVDMAETMATLGWQPPIGVNEGLRQAATTLRESP